VSPQRDLKPGGRPRGAERALCPARAGPRWDSPLRWPTSWCWLSRSSISQIYSYELSLFNLLLYFWSEHKASRCETAPWVEQSGSLPSQRRAVTCCLPAVKTSSLPGGLSKILGGKRNSPLLEERVCPSCSCKYGPRVLQRPDVCTKGFYYKYVTFFLS